MVLKEIITDIHHPLAQHTFDEEELAKWENEPSAFHCVYIEGDFPPRLITGQLSSYEDKKMSFGKLITTKSSFTLGECVLIASLYFSVSQDAILEILNNKIAGDDEIINSLLSITNGHLVYDYQFEVLTRHFFGVYRQQSQLLLKDFRLKRFKMFDVLEKDLLGKFDLFLAKHLKWDVYHNVHSPYYFGGKYLFDYVNQTTNV